MDASMWVAKTGLSAQSTRMTVIANNLANVNTIGFKKDRANFEDLLYQRIVQAGAQADATSETPTGLMLGIEPRGEFNCEGTEGLAPGAPCIFVTEIVLESRIHVSTHNSDN